MASIKETMEKLVLTAEEYALLGIYAESADTKATLKEKLLNDLHKSKNEGMLIIYGTLLYKVENITEEEYSIASARKLGSLKQANDQEPSVPQWD